ncbi:hypothetical protein [Bacillus wiedmannii]|uniref:hypothetical protein n=1 Tax=Bacillus wiedmannii TaxID=1890302 RepID=UPI000BEBA8BF|nr:hypothetical protein [Bacillus wiedmannii]PEA42826.1 hypothetical protein CON83_19560 [Bacillus wiedmannii]PHA30799.1 hypothetical protein COE69_20460 [Bacillus wiedmannii]
MDTSGLQSLAGFCYQIKVFALCLSEINEYSSVKFEHFDDVEVNEKLETEKKLEQLAGKVSINESIKLVQVKKTNVSNETHKKIIYNWILTTVQNPSVSLYQLFTDVSYGNPEKLLTFDCKELYQEICDSDKSKSALITKVKEAFINKYEEFKDIYTKIKESHEVINSENLDNELYEAFKVHLNHGGVSNGIYQSRLEELIRYIEHEILSASIDIKYFECNYKMLKEIIEEITGNIREDQLVFNYTLFREGNKTNLSDPTVIESREYLQLKSCYPNPSQLNRIEKHLVRMQYYEQYKHKQLKNLKKLHINQLEASTYDNYEDVLDELQINPHIDQPVNRLIKTKDRNQRLDIGTKELTDGLCIYLTKSEIENELKISWEEEA